MESDNFTARLANLSPAKRALFELRLKEKSLDALVIQSIPRRATSDTTPLSFAQQRLWFLNQLEPESPVYNESRVVRLVGDLDVGALEKALNEIVARHEVLRTTIVLIDGTPQQRIADSRTVELPLIDLRAWTDSERDAEAQRLITEAIRHPFDLSRDLMLRVLLLRLAVEEHILVLVKHHIGSDGWSSRILWQELTTLYQAFTAGQPNPLPELPIQYADYAVWQRDWLQGEVLESQLSYWKKQLDNIATLQLPTDRPRPAVQSHHGARQSVVLSKNLSERLKALSRREDVTLFMTLLAVFQTVLHRYTEQEDIAVGSPIAGRNRQEMESLIGFFVNTLVLRGDLSGNPTFRELLARVREVALGAYAHQHVPFEKLVEELLQERSFSHSPLFQVMFVLQNATSSEPKFKNLTVSRVTVNSETAKFDLTLSMREENEGLRASLQYNTDLFDKVTVTRILGHFQVLLEGIVANPDQRISDLPILPETEKHQLLVEWNDTKREYPKNKCLHQLFEEQVKNTPDAVAVVFEDRQLTFRELNGRANQLARYLRNQGVGPEVLVGICMERSLEMMVGLLGILKAGGAYVPLDPEYPKERLAFMLEDTKARVLLTQQRLLEKLPEHAPNIVTVDQRCEEIACESEGNLESRATAENLAYLIYTSGSTGKPKGVSVQHRSLVNHIVGFNDNFLGKTAQILPAITKLTFDASLKQVFAPLLCGGPVWLIPEETAKQPGRLIETLSSRATVSINCVPSLWIAIFDFATSDASEIAIDRVSSLWLGGEVVSNQLAEKTLSASSHINFWNFYGPTEATANASAGKITRGGAITLGRPLANVTMYILDRLLQPVAIGVPGELHIGGTGLARGYLNCPELTAEKFIPNPCSTEPGARLYKTGDLARYLPDGNIEFLGRIDTQVKIRGFRIELGEIEFVLSQHPSVREAVVLAREDATEEHHAAQNRKSGIENLKSDKRLVAYVVSRQEPAPTTNELRSFLKQKLPEYMVPSAFVFLEAMPLTPNGKIDRRTLPAPDQSRPELEESYILPRTPVEELLSQIWADVLKVEKVGIHDNFFELGGHSLLALRLISRVRDSFRLELALRKLFEAPTVAGLAKYIEPVCRRATSARALPILPEPVNQDCPLSFSQERFWFLSQLEPNNLAYNVTHGFRLTGSLNIEALEKTLAEIVRRHETLRTTFHLRNGEPLQVISERWSVPLKIIDLRQQTPVDSEAEVQRLFENERRRFFDLSFDLLFRATLLQLGADEHVLIFSTHHIAWDHWCIELFFHELSLLYQAFTTGTLSPLPEIPIQYKHYALWQRKTFQGAELAYHLGYWKQQLSSAPPILNLPTDHPRKPLQDRRGGRQKLVLPRDLSTALRSLSKEAGVTLFMTFLAAFQTLLHRLTGQDDIVVGTPVAGRDRSETESLIGLFLNTLALRTRFSGNPTFFELLARVREVALGAYDHQDLPFEKLVEELQPERDLSRTPIFQVFINMYNFKEASLGLDRLSVKSLNLTESAVQFDISCFIREHSDGIHITFQYDADIFESTTITRMLENFQTLLQGIISNPRRCISDLPMLSEIEQHQLLVEWNDTTRDYPNDKCIHQLFEEQVEKTPDALAVVFEEQQLTYRELNQRANQLAHYLKRLGVGPETLVGICVERSIEMVVGLLGILKIGGAYVPIDPSYPKERLAFMLEDAQLLFLLTQERLIENLPSDGVDLVVCLDRDWEQITKEINDNPEAALKADNLAYAIYTSGSTGKPKAVAMNHRSLCNLLSWQLQNFADPIQARTLQFASLSFDVSFQEIFATWCSGGTLFLIQEELRRDAVGLLRYLSDRSVERILLPSVALQQLAEIADQERVALPSLREIITAGEQLRITQPMIHLLGQLSDCKLRNQYGPTESHVVSVFTLTGVPSDWPPLPSIGQPIANTEIYILDRHLSLVPIGVTGELCIGGAGLARGYLRRPDLTAEKFIPNPFSTEPGARLYKTGDLARYLPDGNIEFLGRIDTQVKIRGFRIELGEIESVLAQHASVGETVVLAREDATGEHHATHNQQSKIENLKSNSRLVAYVVSRNEHALTSSELRHFLKRKLPEYMVPSAFVFLEAMPLTPNGKIDRRALPAPDQSRPELEDSYQAPRTAVEEIIAEIWAEVLKLEKVGIHDNFFELGGHSLLATRAVSRIRQSLQVELPLRALFESPTVAGLAERIEEILRKEQGLQTLPMLATSRDRSLPLSFAQQRLWFLDQLEARSFVYNVPGAVRLRGSLDIGALEQSINEITRRHEPLRTTFSMVEGEPVQLIALSQNVPLHVVDLTEQPESQREEEARRLAREEARRPFDLSRGPLVRASVIRLSEDDHVLLLTMHHIVSDGWSMGVLHRELSVLYRAFTNNEPCPLADLPIQYADYAVWQRQWLQGEVLEGQLSYWKKQLEGIPAVLNLPTDRPRPAVQSFRGKRQSIELSRELTQGLKALSRKEGVTLFMTLLAAFQTLLYRYSGQEDIVVGSPIANRNRTEIEGLIGFFVNTLVLRTNFSGNPTFRELLAQVRETALGAYAHQDLPFEKLVEELKPERSLSHSPLFQIFFNMFKRDDSKLDLCGLTTERFSHSDTRSKFDLTMYVRDQADEIHFNFAYNADLFSESWVACLSQQYRYLLVQIVSAPEQPIHSYSLVNPEARALLPDPSAVMAEPPQQLVTTTFSSLAKQTPKHPAISQRERTWTYQELAERAETLAKALRASGLQRGDVVAIYGPRSFGLIASMIGTLLSGGVLLPIDDTLPNQRKQLMLKEAKAKKLIYVGDKPPDTAWLERDFAPDILIVDPSNGGVVDAGAGSNLQSIETPEVSPDDPAYVFFTSGTTGVPKGVLGCHKGLSHFLTWQRETFAIGANDRCAQLTGLSFDAALRDIFLPLTSGATLCLPETSDNLAGDEIVPWLERERISVIHAVPSLAQSWLASRAEQIFLPSLRRTFFVGEPLTDALVRQWRSALQDEAEIINLYGPTETTLIKCFYRVPTDSRQGVQPVGRPMPDTQALVLSENNQLCGINEPGEIVLRTPFRSLGYINAPEENQKRFVKNPFSDDARDLMYFTGDAGRFAPDGNLEILGRFDDQVKICGVRIEPAEVTAILAQHPLVKSCIVIGKGKGDETCLVAYVVASKQGQATSTALRSYLFEQLPAAMVPSAFVFLDSLPLTPNGKVDRKALPEPEDSSEPEENFVAPRTAVEEMLAVIWAGVLKREKIGIHDNFFDLGGHSLLATQVVSRISKALRVELPLRALFEKPTVAGLSDLIETIRLTSKENQLTFKGNLGETEEITL